MRTTKSETEDQLLKGWAEIAKFLGQTVAVAQRWQRSGMPVAHNGRSVSASAEELTSWVGTAPAGAGGREPDQSEPIRIASQGEELAADLKRGLQYVRQQKKKRTP